jgi:hypothetical protein
MIADGRPCTTGAGARPAARARAGVRPRVRNG